VLRGTKRAWNQSWGARSGDLAGLTLAPPAGKRGTQAPLTRCRLSHRARRTSGTADRQRHATLWTGLSYPDRSSAVVQGLPHNNNITTDYGHLVSQ
jgi:hypothetical protein